jgi:hypothetical protein
MKFWLSASVNFVLTRPCSCFFADLTELESGGRFLRVFLIALMGRKEGSKWLTK